jgi:molybdopterin molybdotransferase
MTMHNHDHPDPSVDEHATLILDLLAPTLGTLGTEQVSLADALGRVTAMPVGSPVDLPLFRNSQ